VQRACSGAVLHRGHGGRRRPRQVEPGPVRRAALHATGACAHKLVWCVCVCVCLFGWAGWGGGGHAVAVAAVKAALRLLQGQGSGCWLTPIKAASIKLPFLGALTKSRKEQSRVPSLLFSFYLCIICACRPPTSLCLQDSAAQRALNVFPSRLDASSTFSLYGLLARGRTAMVRVGASLCRS